MKCLTTVDTKNNTLNIKMPDKSKSFTVSELYRTITITRSSRKRGNSFLIEHRFLYLILFITCIFILDNTMLASNNQTSDGNNAAALGANQTNIQLYYFCHVK